MENQLVTDIFYQRKCKYFYKKMQTVLFFTKEDANTFITLTLLSACYRKFNDI